MPDSVYKTHNPTSFVILGATGDLAKKKLLPALYHLHRRGLLPKLFQVIGFARRPWSDEQFRAHIVEAVKASVKADAAALQDFAKLFVYHQGDFDDPQAYRSLAARLGKRDEEWSVCMNKLFYMAVSPAFYEGIFAKLDVSGLTKGCSPEEGWTRVIIEKPFGRDLKSAQSLDRLLRSIFKEEQIYRIDHYLGKETVQNILAFRFSNLFLEPAWNKEYIESIAVRNEETIGIEERGAFYEDVGALRDFGQSHLLQLLALFAMENPGQFDAQHIRAGRLQLLKALPRLSSSEAAGATVRAQYEGYRSEKDVKPGSKTETYFKIKLQLKNKRWRGVPIYLEHGKRLGRAVAEVVVVFKQPMPCLCPPEQGVRNANVLRYVIQPEERITLSLWVKKPGTELVIEETDFTFDYGRQHERGEFVGPYEKLILDAITGNQTLFLSTEEIDASWRFIDPIEEAWHNDIVPLRFYKPGSSEIQNIPLP